MIIIIAITMAAAAAKYVLGHCHLSGAKFYIPYIVLANKKDILVVVWEGLETW